MSDPSGPDQDAEPTVRPGAEPDTEVTSTHEEPATEVFVAQSDAHTPGTEPAINPGERRFTAPSGMDDGSTQIIDRAPEPATEIISVPPGSQDPNTDPAFAPPMMAPPGGQPRTAAPQAIPPRSEPPKLPGKKRSWGWVVAVVLVIAALAAVAILGTVLLTRGDDSQATQEDTVRHTIQSFDSAIQNGDLATLRSVTCGDTAASYIKYDDQQWSDIHTRVAAAKQYPVVASIDQVVVNGEHAEANVTTFMAYDPSTRSTRSFDLEFRDDQWKICQSSQ
ncbi:Rv0361 family membrane protein [Mycolicibacterium mengxianglii]|uniref:Rv0361 family membrane protein n=1 Tax=Mycolicibacterium mengxianglii TaxID=2736649 RepID=UPI0018D09CE4|nr:DUF4878 domain-containing protein [Mycolicibacterium mengxianglii]